MTTHNPKNERIKRQYFAYLKEAKRHSDPTVDAVAKALARFEQDTNFRDFRSFRIEQAMAFKRRLADRQSEVTGEKLSKATLHSTLANLKRFFQWLAWQPGFRSHLTYADADYFNLSDKETRVATARRDREGPTLEQVLHTLSQMPTETEIQRRNRAVIAFALLTGARDSAIASIKLKHVDVARGSVFQDAREVQTKNSKSFVTYFFPVGANVRQIVEDWVCELRENKLWGNEAPLFPATEIGLGVDSGFTAIGLRRQCWGSASPIRAIFKDAFEAAGLPYFNPHSLRKTLTRLGLTMCHGAEEFKAWSQNLGHDGVITTFTSYGNIEAHRQGEIIHALREKPVAADNSAEAIAQAVVRAIQQSATSPVSFYNPSSGPLPRG